VKEKAHGALGAFQIPTRRLKLARTAQD